MFAGADERDWNKTGSVMHNSVVLDYSSMNNNPAQALSPVEITGAWATFLPGFDKTHHQLSNFLVKEESNTASSTFLGKADHYIGNEVWTVEGSYEVKLEQQQDRWLITALKFNFANQSGNTELPKLAIERLKNNFVLLSPVLKYNRH